MAEAIMIQMGKKTSLNTRYCTHHFQMVTALHLAMLMLAFTAFTLKYCPSCFL